MLPKRFPDRDQIAAVRDVAEQLDGVPLVGRVR